MTPRTGIQNIPSFMKERRHELGLSLQDVADRMNCTKAQVRDLEQGPACNPTLSITLSFCNALECSIGSLLGIGVTEQILTDNEMALIRAHRQIFRRAD